MLRFKSTTLTSSALATALAMSFAIPAASEPMRDITELYGERILFDVYRKDKLIGGHEVLFRIDGDRLIVDSSFNISLRILGLFNYAYSYQSTEMWQNGQLKTLNAEINDDGDLSEVRVEQDGELLRISGPESNQIGPTTLFPTTHWNANVVGSTQVINTITGKINDVSMVKQGERDVTTGDTMRKATHYAYQGELNTEVWYDQQGRWVKMRFPGKDGVMIEYRCRLCGQTQSADGGSSSLTAPKNGT